MVLITKEEAMAMRKRFPKVCISITSRQKKHRKKYYVEEYPDMLRFIEEMRNSGAVPGTKNSDY